MTPDLSLVVPVTTRRATCARACAAWWRSSTSDGLDLGPGLRRRPERGRHARHHPRAVRKPRALPLRVSRAQPRARRRLQDRLPAQHGQVAGFLDIDLEVGARYIPALVNQIEAHGADVATGYRHYLLRQTGGLHRHVLSVAYRGLLKLLLDAGVRTARRAASSSSARRRPRACSASDCDGWFWDTEVMARAALSNLKVVEVPVLFLRRFDKQSTVRLLPDTLRYLVELHPFGPRSGSRSSTSRPSTGRPRATTCACAPCTAARTRTPIDSCAAKIPDGASVVDLCCGTGGLYRHALAAGARISAWISTGTS